jgi:hypothetical protein
LLAPFVVAVPTQYGVRRAVALVSARQRRDQRICVRAAPADTEGKREAIMRRATMVLWTVGAALVLMTPVAGRAQERATSSEAVESHAYTTSESTSTTETTESAPRHSLTLYAGAFGNKDYIQVWEGLALSIGVHERVALLGRITGIHIIDADRFREGDSGLGEAGLGFRLADNTTLSVLGGTYFGDIDDPIIDGALSTAFQVGDRWVFFTVAGLYGFESNRWQGLGYVSTPITDPTEDFILFGGLETIVYNEGQFRVDDDWLRNPEKDHVKFQVGPVLTLYKRSWDAGLRLGVGGGDYGVYGTGTIWKTFSF